MENDSEKKTHYKLGLDEVLSLASCYFYDTFEKEMETAKETGTLRWSVSASPPFWLVSSLAGD